ncbi:AMP-binding protein [Kribbia dieselivorans]|uniref:AMP-binding protein n=1 Tax=Kribbia dieselivorans TaxID=331526 RepID=UPI0008397F54|nr:AMP-binding protein [Kribbia dieselivorans]
MSETVLAPGLVIAHEPTVAHLLAHLSATHGERVALIDGELRTTYAQLQERGARLAGALAELGLGAGDVLAIWLPSSTATVEYVAAAAQLGAIAFGVNTKLRSHEVLQALVDSGASTLVVEPGFKGIDFMGMLAEMAARLPDSLRHIVTLGEGAEVPEALRPLAVAGESLLAHEPVWEIAATPQTRAHAFSSSGTTSSPKLVLHDHAGLVHHAYAVAKRFGYHAPNTVVLGALPFCGVFGYNTLLAGLAAGAPVVIQAVFKAAEAVQLIRSHGVTHTNVSDEMLRRILDEDDLSTMPTWREAGFGSFTALDAPGIVAQAAAAGRKFFQTFGSSEVQALMTYPAAGSGVERWGLGGGVPISGAIRVRVTDPDSGEVLPDGERGEIEVSGPNVTCGYLNREGIPDLRSDGFFRTGDLGYMDGDDVVYLSRAGDSLRLGGFLVSPEEIESFLEDLPGVHQAQIVAVETPEGRAVVGFVLAEVGEAFDEEAVLAECRRQLARFKVPRRVFVVDEFPTLHGANGVKIQKNKLRDLATELLTKGGADVAS